MSQTRRLQVVAGGTSGMGFATAKALGVYGPILIGGRNEKRLESALAELKAAGVEAYGKSCDISDPESLRAFIEYGLTIAPIGNAVNAAAVDAGGSDLIWKINVIGTINFVEAFLSIADHIRVINFSSITGYFYQPSREELMIWEDPKAGDFFEKSFTCATTKEMDPRMAFMGQDFLTYCASKRFVMYYTQANALRFGRKNSQIFSIAPGSFDTPMLRQNKPEDNARIAQGTAFGRLGEPDEMADFICKLLAPGHDYLTGCDLVFDGGKQAMGTVKQYE